MIHQWESIAPMYSYPIMTSIDENPLPICLAMCIACQDLT